VADGELTPDGERVRELAKSYCSEVFVRAAEECVQIHGGIGFTWSTPRTSTSSGRWPTGPCSATPAGIGGFWPTWPASNENRRQMRIGMPLSHSGGFKETVAELGDYEKAGLGIVFVPEAKRS
jgi:Acyl-CoA dehydrogenase, C-terminal domain